MRLLRSEGVDDIDEKLLKTKQNIVEETADVLNCVEQMSLMFGEDEVKKVRKEKVQRCLNKYLKD